MAENDVDTDDTTSDTDGTQDTTPDRGGDQGQTYSRDDLEKIVEKRLKRERAKFSDYDDLKAKAKASDDAAKAKATVEEQVEALRKDIAQRDADAVTERADQAADKLQAKLVRGGLSDDDATTLVGSIDPMRLLVDGKPDTGEIDKLAKSLLKISTRPAPDGDQGRKGGDAPPSMNQLIRDAAKRNTVSG